MKRAADSLQMAAALVATDQQTASMPFVSLDQRLAQAAEKQGFDLLA